MSVIASARRGSPYRFLAQIIEAEWVGEGRVTRAVVRSEGRSQGRNISDSGWEQLSSSLLEKGWDVDIES